MVEHFFAEGTAVDLALSAFPVGHATTTVGGAQTFVRIQFRKC